MHTLSHDSIPELSRKLDHENCFWFSNGPMSSSKALQAILIVQESVILLMQLKKRYGKIHFISALASATSYLDQNIGQIIGNDSSRAIYVELLNEITMIAAVKD
jgi:2-dehydropantoate 2-reductase